MWHLERIGIPVTARLSGYVDLMLVQRLRRWINIKST